MSKYQMVGDNFRLGYRFQRHWGAMMAAAFFCGELGGGLFFVSLILESPVGLVIGLFIAAVLKPVFHLTHMGSPKKSWRAILRPDRSWISRGLIAIVVLTAAGTGHVINLMWGDVIPFGPVLELLAGAAALVVMTYQGLSMAHSSAISIWNTMMMPALGFLYALTGGAAVFILLPGANILPDQAPSLPLIMQGLLTVDLLMVLGFVYAAYRGSAGAKISAQLLINTHYAYWFWGGVVGLGLVLPLVLLSQWQAIIVAVASILTGFFIFRILIFKAGIYEPVTFTS